MPRKTRKTLRKMTPLSREIAKLANELASINVRLMNLTQKVARAEASADALDAFMAEVRPKGDES